MLEIRGNRYQNSCLVLSTFLPVKNTLLVPVNFQHTIFPQSTVRRIQTNNKMKRVMNDIVGTSEQRLKQAANLKSFSSFSAVYLAKYFFSVTKSTGLWFVDSDCFSRKMPIQSREILPTREPPRN